MENIAAYDVNTVRVDSVDAGSHAVSNESSPETTLPSSSDGFNEIMAKAELEFWDNQKESTQAGLKNLAEEITHSLSGLRSLNLSLDQDTKRMVVRVVDQRTGHVVQQLPSKQMVDLVKQMRDLEGLLFKASS